MMALKCQNAKKTNFSCCAPLSSGDLLLSYNWYIFTFIYFIFFFSFLPLSDVVHKFSLIPREGKKASKQHREQVQLLLSRWWYEDSEGGCKHRGQCYLLLPVINTIVCLPFTQLADVFDLAVSLSSLVSNETWTSDTLYLQGPPLMEKTRNITQTTRRERECDGTRIK